MLGCALSPVKKKHCVLPNGCLHGHHLSWGCPWLWPWPSQFPWPSRSLSRTLSSSLFKFAFWSLSSGSWSPWPDHLLDHLQGVSISTCNRSHLSLQISIVSFEIVLCWYSGTIFMSDIIPVSSISLDTWRNYRLLPSVFISVEIMYCVVFFSFLKSGGSGSISILYLCLIVFFVSLIIIIICVSSIKENLFFLFCWFYIYIIVFFNINTYVCSKIIHFYHQIWFYWVYFANIVFFWICVRLSCNNFILRSSCLLSMAGIFGVLEVWVIIFNTMKPFYVDTIHNILSSDKSRSLG